MRRSRTLAVAVIGVAAATFTLQTPAMPIGLDAQLHLSPAIGPPTTSIEVKGRGFQANELVDVLFDITLLATPRAKSDGRVRVNVEAPVDALPGDHAVSGTGEESGITAETTFLVRTNWPKLRFDDGNSGFNRYENEVGSSNVDLLTRRWSVAMDGHVAPNPIVVDGVVYAVSYYGVVEGFDPATGSVVWRAVTGSLMSGAAPAVGEGTLYTGTLNGEALAFDLATGDVLWRQNTRVPVELSPVVANDLVLIVAGDLYALDATTGALVWSSSVAPEGSPAFAGGLLYVGDINGFVYAMDPVTGSLVWSTHIPNLDFQSEIVAVDGLVAVTGDDAIHVLDGSSGEEVWRRALEDIAQTPAVADGVVYQLSGDQNRHLQAMDLHTGDILWSRGVVDDAMNPIVANGLVYVGEGGYPPNPYKMHAYLTATGSPRWESDPMSGLPPGGIPALADGVLYVAASDGGLYAYALP
jgi:outer membrane protein assembly factor BamB